MVVFPKTMKLTCSLPMLWHSFIWRLYLNIKCVFSHLNNTSLPSSNSNYSPVMALAVCVLLSLYINNNSLYACIFLEKKEVRRTGKEMEKETGTTIHSNNNACVWPFGMHVSLQCNVYNGSKQAFFLCG